MTKESTKRKGEGVGRFRRRKEARKGKRRTDARRQRPAEAPKAVHMNTSLSISTLEREESPGRCMIDIREIQSPSDLVQSRLRTTASRQIRDT